jgi:uncharacterized membrane protein YjjP (DUF1212 family)
MGERARLLTFNCYKYALRLGINLSLLHDIYAIGLNTKVGRRFADDYTWASVVLGASLILAALWFIIPRGYWQKAVLAFVVAGIPMIARSLINRARKSSARLAV